MHASMNTNEGQMIECRAGIAHGIRFASVLDENRARGAFDRLPVESESRTESGTESEGVFRANPRPTCGPAIRRNARAENFCRVRAIAHDAEKQQPDVVAASALLQKSPNRDLITPLKNGSSPPISIGGPMQQHS